MIDTTGAKHDGKTGFSRICPVRAGSPSPFMGSNAALHPVQASPGSSGVQGGGLSALQMVMKSHDRMNERHLAGGAHDPNA